MAFKVTSNSFKDGDYLGADHVLSADFGFGCAGGGRLGANENPLLFFLLQVAAQGEDVDFRSREYLHLQ